MRLDFNVLWVDDQPARVEAQMKAISAYMEAEGFLFRPTRCRSLDEVRPHLADDYFGDEVDLILVDWDLGGGAQGQDVIAEVREKIQYKDVIFYSAQTPPTTLRELALGSGLEGVFCTSRNDLPGEVAGVFDSLVKKVLDLDHTRGIVMGSTSDIDQMVLVCLTAVHSMAEDATRDDLVKGAIQIIDARVNEHVKELGELKKSATMASLMQKHMLFTANDRLRVLSRALDLGGFKQYSGKRDAVLKYMKDVVPKRNILGHKVLSPAGRPTGVSDGEGGQVTLDEMRSLRKLILELRNDFRELVQMLTAPNDLSNDE